MTETGRAGRVRLERRLVTARHGALLLDRKDRILAEELERLRLRAARAREEWEDLAGQAAVWLARAAALDGRERITAAASPDPAEVQVRWGGAVGVGYPEDALYHPPVASPAGGSSALSFAAESHRAALAAGIRCAAVQRAILLVSVEVMATRVRRRAIEERWIPGLEDELVTIRLLLDEQELEENLRLRWSADEVRRRGTSDPEDRGSAERPDG